MFRKKTFATGPVEYIVVGLGNPDRKYENTRHNAGFIMIDFIADKIGVKINRVKFKSLVGEGNIGGSKVLLMKPSTYMNNSGEAVIEAMKFYKIPPENVIVLLDDINLDVGKMRIRSKGSDGGQKGMRSIIYLSGKDNFPRVKIGIGKKPNPEYDLASWVLSKFTKDELATLEKIAENSYEAVELIIQGKTDRAMNLFN
ncbi:MAG: aminoacyl-tRNA hydrolase [Oscillospiraceae bacterium]|nr:aminoacyl-tRNA hydrolase [Oscillospiraceae bacterium]